MPLPPQWRWKLDRFKEKVAAAFRDDREAERRPRLCPACNTLVGSTATKCHECGTSLTFSVAAVSKSFGGFLPEESPVTYFMLAANFMLFVVTVAASAQAGGFSLLGSVDGYVLYRLGARHTGSILAGFEWWRLVLPIFLHGGLIHIGMNMMWLKDLGPQLEEVYGSARFLFLYMATGIFGFVCTTVWDLVRADFAGIGIGASGSMMGLLGLALAITTRRGGAYMRMLKAQFVRSALFVLVIGLVVPFIDNAAHLGGFASGFLLGKVFDDKQPTRAADRKLAYALGWLAGLAIVGSFLAAILKFLSGPPVV